MEFSTTSKISKENDDYEEEENQEDLEEEEEEEDYKGVFLEEDVSSEDYKESLEELSNLSLEVGLLRPTLASRRAVAEILPYNLQYVQSLHQMSLKAIAASFNIDPIDMCLLSKGEQEYVIRHLSLDLPLSIVAGRIESEEYWKSRCEKYLGTRTFQMADMSEYGDSYRRRFFESYLADRICNFVPLLDDFKGLEEDVSSGGRFVQRLILDQLLIPVKTGEEQIDYDDHDESTAKDYCHVNLESLGKYFTDLEELSVRYAVNNCGLNFDWTMFSCTEKDVTNLCGMTKDTKSLRSMTVAHSRLNDTHVSILATNLGNWCTLESLCLAHNRISDDGARLLGKFLKTDSSLACLYLNDNKIHSEGGMALAQGLKSNRSLKKLNLRLNFIGYPAVRVLTVALKLNPVLESLNLSANLLDDACCETLGRSMQDFSNLSKLNLSANPRITEKGVFQLLQGLQHNDSLVKLELKGIPTEPDYAFCFAEKLGLNYNRKCSQEKSNIGFAIQKNDALEDSQRLSKSPKMS